MITTNNITTNIKPLQVHSMSGNVTTQSQQQITSGGLDTNVETDPIFRHSAAYNITDTDIQRWDAASGGIDLSAYVTKSELSTQAYLTSESDPIFSASPAAGITNEDIENWNAGGAVDLSSYVTYEYLSAQAYLTSESDPIFSASPAAGITTQDIENWNAGGAVDLSSYVTYDYLSAQAYLTSVTFPDYSSTYQAKGDYITPEVLAQQSYLTTETEPAFNSSPASTITDTDITNWNAAAGTIDMSAYVTKSELVTQSYITINDVVFPDYSNTYQAKGNYLTSESDPIFSASPAAGITNEDIERWDNGGGSVDLSSYVTYDYLSAQAYLTSVTFPDYSSTYQAKGDYVTPTILNNQAYVTATQLYAQAYVTQNSIVFPDYSSTYQAKGDYVTPSQLVAQGYITSVTFPDYSSTYQAKGDYVTPSQLVAQGYITSVTFPDYSSTYQAKGDYVTPSLLVAQSYVTPSQLVAQSYVTSSALVSQSYVTTSALVSQSYVTTSALVSQSYITTSELVSQSYVTSSALVSQSYATKSYVANYVEDAIHEPEVIWETNGVGLTALETNMSASPAWQLTNLDMTPYKHIKIYSRSNQKSGTTASASTTAAMVLEMSLDPRAAGPYGGHYIGSTVSQKPNDANRLATLTCAVSADKTSFAVLRMTNLYGTAATGNSDVNAYVFKIVGYYDEIGGIDTSGDLSNYVTKVELSQQSYLKAETDPIFSASPAAGITTQDIQNWNTGSGIDLSSYVTYDYLSAQAYLTSVTFPDYSSTYQAKGNYLTNETDPVFSASAAAGITAQDIQNWNAGAGTDLSAYVKKSELVAQSYVTQNTIVFPDYSNTYQAKGNYLTTETDPVFSASPAHTITSSDITRWNNNRSTVFEIVTKSQYIDRQDNVMYIISDADPISGVDLTAYVKKSELVTQSYITPAKLVAQAYITSAEAFANYTSYAYFYSYINDKLGTIETVLSQI